jgi:catalase
MPLPADEKIIAFSERLIDQLTALFGKHPGFRPAPAKGIMLSGEFTPSPDASTLTRAPHALRASTPVTVRFSNSTGVPLIPDTDPDANPRGMAIRFHLAEHVHTDIVAHSTDGFPVRTGDEFLEFLQALGTGDPTGFLGGHSAALAFVQTPKPAPSSFARESYFGVTAMRFTGAQGSVRFGRYRILPEAGNDHLSQDETAARSANYLFDEIAERIAAGPISFRVAVQVAAEGDIVDDATIHWPEERPVETLGTLTLNALVDESEAAQKQIIFDPIPRVDGIDPSDDPLLELRAAVYLISGRRRRAA